MRRPSVSCLLFASPLHRAGAAQDDLDAMAHSKMTAIPCECLEKAVALKQVAGEPDAHL
jgi:hypothetical protein